jgi:hypothetical protein
MHYTLTLFITSNLKNHNLIQALRSTKINAKFPWPPIMKTTHFCRFNHLLKSDYLFYFNTLFLQLEVISR